MADSLRRWFHWRSVRARVTTVAAAVVFVVLVVAAIVMVDAQRSFLLEELEETLAAAAEIHATDAEPANPLPSPTDDDGVAQVVAADGTVIAATANMRGRPPMTEPPAPGVDDVVRTIDSITVDDGPYVVLSRRAGDRVVHVGGTRADIDEIGRLLAGSFAVGVPVLTAVLGALVWWLVGRTLRPVEAIRAEVDRIGGSDLDRRVPEPPGHDEVTQLARTMNSMLARLETAADSQRSFVADASHELRTPLTRMRAELEVDLSHPDGADLTATHRSALEEVIGLQRLVDDLLALARIDAGVTAGAPAPVDLVDVARRQAERSTRPGVTVTVAAPEPVVVEGDAESLGRAIGNLVDNAARHAASIVQVEVRANHRDAVVRVVDDGPGIPESARERVFERFTRLDAARGSATGGAGLGLAIARDVVERHGGSVRAAAPGQGEGAVLEVVLPTSPR